MEPSLIMGLALKDPASAYQTPSHAKGAIAATLTRPENSREFAGLKMPLRAMRNGFSMETLGLKV